LLSVHLLFSSNTGHSFEYTSPVASVRMPSVRQILGAVAVGLVTVATALPAQPKLSPQARRAYEYGVEARKYLQARQDPATGLPDGLTDIDILEL
jgi:hypothetical protein